MKIREYAIFSFIISLLILLFGATHVDDRVLGLREILNPAAAPAATIVATEEHRRPPDQTFLTFPEWFLVFSPAEYATFVRSHAPSEFPFFGHISQFWESYRPCLHATLGKYPLNYGYNVMILVIGSSTTVEYTLRGAYEAFIGRFTALTCGDCRTQEDDYGATVAQDYVDFIRVQPWYEYNFIEKLKGLWTKTDFFGPSVIRKWERKYILTSDYLVKAAYGKIIKVMTKAAYEDPLPTTAVLVRNLPGANPELKILKSISQSETLVALPRYQPFTTAIVPLAMGGAKFVEIAGNRGEILLSLIAPSDWRPVSADYQVLFTQPILTDPSHVRVALTTPVENLNLVLSSFSKEPFSIEHIFDY